MNILIHLLSILTYFFTALLPVHIFAMHHENGYHTVHLHQHTETHPCHDTHGDMEFCMNQSFWMMSNNFSIETIHVFHQLYELYVDSIVDHYILTDRNTFNLRFHDPWRDHDSSFHTFVDSHYGEVVLHC